MKRVTSKDTRKKLITNLFKNATKATKITNVFENDISFTAHCLKYDQVSKIYDFIGIFKLLKYDFNNNDFTKITKF